MKFDDWAKALPDEIRTTLTVSEAWNAGALSMLETLIKLGHIGEGYAEKARNDVKDLLGGLTCRAKWVDEAWLQCSPVSRSGQALGMDRTAEH